MADPPPADAGTEGQGPAADEGLEPAGSSSAEGQVPKGGERVYQEAYVRQLRRESAGLRTKLSEAEASLSEHAEAGKSELQKLTERASSAEARASEAELRLLRLEVAAEAELDVAAVQFLSGSTREELEHRAAELKKLLGDKGRPPAAGFDGGARQPAPPAKGTPQEEHNAWLLRAMGRESR